MKSMRGDLAKNTGFGFTSRLIQIAIPSFT